MKARTGGEWMEILDYHRGEDEYRIQVRLWQTLDRIEGMYFVRRPSLKLLWSYLREVGLKHVLRKVFSRRAEERRNEKYVAWGVGEVLEAPRGGRVGKGSMVVFLTPSHPECVERVALPEALMHPLDEVPSVLRRGALHRLSAAEPPGPGESGNPEVRPWWEEIRGWSRFSGIPLPSLPFERLVKRLGRLLAEGALDEAEILEGITDVRCTSERRAGRGERPTGVLFGYGNYAKITILPEVESHIDVQTIHEIDPTQIPEDDERTWDTSPRLRKNERDHDVWFVAGYHHTHAPLAADAVSRGSYAVVEKPLAVDGEQLKSLEAALQPGSRIFACFQKRYSPFNDLAREDLGIGAGDPVAYHCVVYEVPLPPHHWYRWPNSGSRLLSNGCHWIDHFLFLNDFVSVRDSQVFRAPNGVLNVSVVLENDAVFTMALTEWGSERIGLQDHVELRTETATVRIRNGSRYEAEGPERIARRKRRIRLDDYGVMYRSISRRIVRGEPGDEPRSILRSAALTLELERKLQDLETGGG